MIKNIKTNYYAIEMGNLGLVNISNQIITN